MMIKKDMLLISLLVGMLASCQELTETDLPEGEWFANYQMRRQKGEFWIFNFKKGNLLSITQFQSLDSVSTLSYRAKRLGRAFEFQNDSDTLKLQLISQSEGKMRLISKDPQNIFWLDLELAPKTGRIGAIELENTTWVSVGNSIREVRFKSGGQVSSFFGQNIERKGRWKLKKLGTRQILLIEHNYGLLANSILEFSDSSMVWLGFGSNKKKEPLRLKRTHSD